MTSNNPEKAMTETIKVRCPPRLPSLVDAAAERKCTTISDYIRRAVVEKLEADGIDTGVLA